MADVSSMMEWRTVSKDLAVPSSGKYTGSVPPITPEEAHHRIHHKVYSYINSRNLTSPYGLYLEDVSSDILLRSLKKIDLTTHPKTSGPQDDDPLAGLSMLLKRHLTPSQAYELGWEQPNRNEEARNEVMKVFVGLREAQGDRSKNKFAIDPIPEPVPIHLQPMETILQRSSILAAPSLGKKKKKKMPAPFKLSQLFRGSGRHAIDVSFSIEPFQVEVPDEDETLDIKMPSDARSNILGKQFRNVIAQAMIERRGLEKPLGQEPQWDMWREKAERMLDNWPRTIPPPIFPIPRIPSAAVFPLSYQEFRQHSFNGVPANGRMGLGSLCSDVDMSSTPTGVINMIKNYNIPVGSDREWRLADPYSISLLDHFDDVLFCPLTPSTRSSSAPGSGISRIRPSSVTLDLMSCLTPSRRPGMPMSWRDNKDLGPPIMSFVRSSLNTETPTRTMNRAVPLTSASSPGFGMQSRPTFDLRPPTWTLPRQGGSNYNRQPIQPIHTDLQSLYRFHRAQRAEDDGQCSVHAPLSPDVFISYRQDRKGVQTAFTGSLGHPPTRQLGEGLLLNRSGQHLLSDDSSPHPRYDATVSYETAKGSEGGTLPVATARFATGPSHDTCDTGEPEDGCYTAHCAGNPPHISDTQRSTSSEHVGYNLSGGPSSLCYRNDNIDLRYIEGQDNPAIWYEDHRDPGYPLDVSMHGHHGSQNYGMINDQPAYTPHDDLEPTHVEQPQAGIWLDKDLNAMVMEHRDARYPVEYTHEPIYQDGFVTRSESLYENVEQSSLFQRTDIRLGSDGGSHIGHGERLNILHAPHLPFLEELEDGSLSKHRERYSLEDQECYVSPSVDANHQSAQPPHLDASSSTLYSMSPNPVQEILEEPESVGFQSIKRKASTLAPTTVQATSRSQDKVAERQDGMEKPVQRRKAVESVSTQCSPSLDQIVMSKKARYSIDDALPKRDHQKSARDFFWTQNIHISEPEPVPLPLPLSPPRTTEHFKENDINSADEWKAAPLIKNPGWYSKILELPAQNLEPVTVLTSMRLLHNRTLTQALNIYFDRVEQEGSLQNVDLILSASTAVIFRELSRLDKVHKELLSDLQKATRYYRRVIVVLETVNFGIHDKRRSRKKEDQVNPLNPATMKAIPAFRRAVAIAVVAEDKSPSQVDIVFAVNGATEVATVLRGVVEEEFGLLRASMGDREAREACEDRKWLHVDPNLDARQMVKGLYLNPFATAYILSKTGTFEFFAFEMTSKQREEEFGKVVGEAVIRCNNLLETRLAKHSASSGPVVAHD